MYAYLISNITALKDVDFFGWICVLFLLLAAIVYGAELIGKFFNMIGKPLKWKKNRETDHDLILKNSEAIKELAELHKKDADTVTEHEKKLSDDLSTFMIEVRSDIKQFADNRVHDREKSFEIQKELKDSISVIVEKNVIRDTQINSLIIAQKEMMAEKINSKYKYYLSIGGIPEDEYDEFVSLHAGYKAVGGNSHGDAKFEYCINHLPVIPVETKLVIKHEHE